MSKRPPAKVVHAPETGNNGHIQALQVEINADALTWEDLYLVMSIDKDAPFTRELVGAIRGLFERVVVGGAAAVPVVHTQAVIEQMGLAIQRMGDPKNSAPA